MPAAADAAKKRSFGSRVLKIGTKGSDVRALQRYLGEAGFHATVDGKFGPATRRKVRRWERSEGLKRDGRVTRREARQMRQTVEPKNSAGGAQYEEVPKVERATIAKDGSAIAPAGAPEAVKQVIAAGNKIHDKPYRYGGGHGKWRDSGYDCSGSMSYALHGADLLDEALNSTGFESYGDAGKGRWITTYANSGHSYMVVAGLRFDTSGAKGRDGSRWTTERRSARGFVVRHVPGL